MTDEPVLLCPALWLMNQCCYVLCYELNLRFTSELALCVGQFLSLDRCMMSRTHHYGIVQDGFTALKSPSLCLPCGHPRLLWGVPVMWSFPQDTSWRHGDLPSCPAYSPLHPPIPWSPHPHGAHRTFLPLPRPCCSLRSKKHVVWSAGPVRKARSPRQTLL